MVLKFSLFLSLWSVNTSLGVNFQWVSQQELESLLPEQESKEHDTDHLFRLPEVNVTKSGAIYLPALKWHFLVMVYGRSQVTWQLKMSMEHCFLSTLKAERDLPSTKEPRHNHISQQWRVTLAIYFKIAAVQLKQPRVACTYRTINIAYGFV